MEFWQSANHIIVVTVSQALALSSKGSDVALARSIRVAGEAMGVLKKIRKRLDLIAWRENCWLAWKLYIQKLARFSWFLIPWGPLGAARGQW